ncbi:MAG: hypothetical protein HPZ91_09955 [Lentisphaeria bacterium]|nr:hypothetical protein [Lentisphaeria bacterium]
MAADFHAHRPKSAARTLVSCAAEELSRYPLTSLELHPWKLPEAYEPLTPEFKAALEHAAALGEIGLDRLRGPSPAVQQAYLDELLALAGAMQKPVVIHCVRATAELLAALKRHPRLSVLLHGFRGKPEQLEMLRRHGLFVSLGPKALNGALLEHLRLSGLDRIGFETDDAPEPVEQLLEEAAGHMHLPYRSLEARTDGTFGQFLGI